MLTTKKFSDSSLTQFKPINLDGLNQKASMLTRLDNKYIIRESVLQDSMLKLAKHFDILEINDQRLFTYETCYFDDDKLTCYYDHHQGRRQRIKIRTRKYCDTNLCFVEAKLKDIRGVTIKKRYPYEFASHGTLDHDALAYVSKVQLDMYRKGLVNHLQPTLEMSYKRITLVAKDGGERLTLDQDIHFYKNGAIKKIPNNVFIVETKSANANGIADAIFRSHHQHPTNKCSKYCLGMCITEQVKKINNFMPALRRLGVLPSLGGSYA